MKYVRPMHDMVRFVRRHLTKASNAEAAINDLRNKFKRRFPSSPDHQFNSAMILAAGDIQKEMAARNARHGAVITMAEQVLAEFAERPAGTTLGDLVAMDQAARDCKPGIVVPLDRQ